MRSGWITWGLLIGVVFFATGASVDGVREARELQLAGDIAKANNQPLVAYQFYEKAARAFAGTPHGQLAKREANKMGAKLAKPARSPAKDGPLCHELKDLLCWP